MKNEISDHISQCASSDYWPDGLQYDPEGDGTPIGSLGVYEHWNNAADRQYTRNLDPVEGIGIELNYVDASQIPAVGIAHSSIQSVSIAAPNPFSISTTFSLPENGFFSLPGNGSSSISLKIYNLKGQLINQYNFAGSDQLSWDGSDANGKRITDGIYLYKIHDPNSNSQYSGKVLFKQ